jgi:hypothetical protein
MSSKRYSLLNTLPSAKIKRCLPKKNIVSIDADFKKSPNTYSLANDCEG